MTDFKIQKSATRIIALPIIFLPDVRKINVADLMFIIKCYKQRTVADRNISHTISDFGFWILDLFLRRFYTKYLIHIFNDKVFFFFIRIPAIC